MPLRTILIDDEQPARDIVKHYLKDFTEIEIAGEFTDGFSGLKAIQELKPDLVFLDVDMPGMTGYELCNKLRSLPMHKKTPVVFCTRLDDFNSRTKSTMAGGNDFIAKPFLFIELTVKALIHVMRGKLHPAK